MMLLLGICLVLTSAKPPCRTLLFSNCVCLVLSWLLSLLFSMQCWRQCPLPPAQPNVALGSSASPPSMRSTITKLIELSLLKGCWNTTFLFFFMSFSPPSVCMPIHTALSCFGPVHVHTAISWCLETGTRLSACVCVCWCVFLPPPSITRCWGNGFSFPYAWSVTPSFIIILSPMAKHNVTENSL